MKKNTISLILMSALAAGCASTPVYKEAKNDGFGYSEKEVHDDQYAVSFKLRGEDVEKATDLALRRAAELTIEEGHDWFVVAKEKVEVEQTTTLPGVIPTPAAMTRNCGLLGCATTYTYAPGTMNVTSYNVTEEVDSNIYIVMGDGVTPNIEDAYSAQIILSQVTDD